MQKLLKITLVTLLLSGVIFPQALPEILPANLLAFPFGSNDHLGKIRGDAGSLTIWSEKKISSWASEQGFFITPDNPAGGYQYRRGLLIKTPGLEFDLAIPTTARAESQPYGWKLVLDMASPYSPGYEDQLSSNFKNYENILRYDIFIEDIYYTTIESGYGVSVPSPIVLEIPYIREVTGRVKISIKMKNHPANFAVLYDAFLTL